MSVLIWIRRCSERVIIADKIQTPFSPFSSAISAKQNPEKFLLQSMSCRVLQDIIFFHVRAKNYFKMKYRDRVGQKNVGFDHFHTLWIKNQDVFDCDKSRQWPSVTEAYVKCLTFRFDMN